MKAYTVEVTNNAGLVGRYVAIANSITEAASKGFKAALKETDDEGEKSLRVTTISELPGDLLK